MYDLVPNLLNLVAARWILSTRSRTPGPLMEILRRSNPQGNPQSLAPSGRALARYALGATHECDDRVFACLASHLSLHSTTPINRRLNQGVDHHRPLNRGPSRPLPPMKRTNHGWQTDDAVTRSQIQDNGHSPLPMASLEWRPLCGCCL